MYCSVGDVYVSRARLELAQFFLDRRERERERIGRPRAIFLLPRRASSDVHPRAHTVLAFSRRGEPLVESEELSRHVRREDKILLREINLRRAREEEKEREKERKRKSLSIFTPRIFSAASSRRRVKLSVRSLKVILHFPVSVCGRLFASGTRFRKRTKPSGIRQTSRSCVGR